jgi:hypothetical protein
MAMKRSINFSIFRRKEGPQRTHATEQTDRQALYERLAGRSITIEEGDLTPVEEGNPPLDWETVNGQITLVASAIEGLLEGRARVTAEYLKSLNPSPIGYETLNSIEYQVSLATLIPQIQDLIGPIAAEVSAQPEFETPFTVLAREDSVRFGRTDRKKDKQDTSDGPAAEVARPGSGDSQSSQHIANAKKELLPPLFAMQGVERESRIVPHEQNNITPKEKPDLREESSAPQPATFNNQKRPATPEQDPKSDESKREAAQVPWPGAEDPVSQGVERLQEIFMTSEPLDGRSVASLVQELPGVTGALILLKGGAVIGGRLPASIDVGAAFQVPEVLQNFTRFILQIEAVQKARSIVVTVTSATTISLVDSGKVVLFVTHKGRKLLPGLAQRLTQTAEALELIYGN